MLFQKLTRLITLTMAVVFIFAAPALAVNMLATPGFENGLNGWTRIEPAVVQGTLPTWNLAPSPWGSYSAINTINVNALQSSAPEYYTTLKQEFNASVGTTYYATLQAKTNISPLSTAQAGVAIQFLNSAGFVIFDSSDMIGGTTDWKNLYLAVTAPPGTAKIRYNCSVYASKDDVIAQNGLAYFDEAVLTTSYIEPPGGSQLQNPGFENAFNGWTITEPALDPNLTPPPAPTWSLQTPSPWGVYSAKNTINIEDLVTEPLKPGDPLPDYYATVSQELYGASAGETYYATLQAKTDISVLSTAQAGILIQFLNSVGTVLSEASDTIGGTTDWKNLYLAVTAPAGTVKIKYSCMVFALRDDLAAHDGVVLFDEAVLTTDYIAPPGGSQLQNPGFENGLNGWDITEAALDPNLTPPPGPTWSLEQNNPLAESLSAKNTINIEDLLTEPPQPGDPLPDYYAAVSQDIDAPELTTYYVTLQATTDINPASTAQAGVSVVFLNDAGEEIEDDDGNIIEYKDMIGGVTPVEQLYLSFDTPENTAKIRYSCSVFALREDLNAQGGIAIFDEAVLTTDYIAPPVVENLQNPGFENEFNHWDITEAYLEEGTAPTWSLEQNNPLAESLSAKNTINIEDLSTEPPPNGDPLPDYYAAVSQDIDAPELTTYYVTLQAKTNINSASTAQAGVSVVFLNDAGEEIEDDDGNIIEYKDMIGGNTPEEQLYLSFNTPEDTVKIRYSCSVFALREDLSAQGGTAIFDEAVLTTDYIPPPVVESLQNPGFENGFNHWDITEAYLEEGTAPTWDLEQVAPFMGIFSAKNTINVEDLSTVPPPNGDPLPDYYAAVSQDIDAPELTTYYVTLQAMTEISVVSTAQAGISVVFLNDAGEEIEDDDGNIIEYKDMIGGNTNWTQLYLSFDTPEGTAKIRYSCSVFALREDLSAQGGIAMFDEAVLTTDPIPPPGGDLQNPGFENGLNAWDVSEPVPSSITWDLETQSPFAGTYSARNTIDVTNCSDFDYYATVSQEFVIPQPVLGTMYYATIEAQTNINPISMAAGGLAIEFLDDGGLVIEEDLNGNPVGDEDIIGGETSWRLLYVAAAAPQNAVKVRYVAFVSAKEGDTLANGGIVQFDQAVLSTDVIQPPTPPGNLMNPDMENGLHDWTIVEPYINWPQPNQATSSWIAQAEYVSGGALAAKNTIDNLNMYGNENYFAALTQEFDAGPNDPFYATVQIKTDFDFNSSATAGLKIEALNAAGEVVSDSDESVVGVNGWTQLQVSGTLADNDSIVKMRYMLYVYANAGDVLADGGVAYFDDAFLDFAYVNHLGVLNGQDTFPQETAQQSYYTGAASTRATIRYTLGSSPTQSDIYNTYHWTTPGEDMISGEIVTALNSEIAPIAPAYHFSDWYETTNQIDAIKNFVYWIDYLPPMGGYSPALVPVNGDLNWRLVRGIVTDVKPHPFAAPMPEFNVEGLWVNDPEVSGLGFNIYQTTTAFQADYLPLVSTGTYKAVYEPPENLNQEAYKKELENTSCHLVQARPNSSLVVALAQIDEMNQERKAETQESVALSREKGFPKSLMSHGNFQKAPAPVLCLIYLAQALPDPLKGDAEFLSLFDKAQEMRKFNVTSLDDNKEYTLLALDRFVSNITPSLTKNEKGDIDGTKASNISNPYQKNVLKTHVLVQVNPINGACLQATWDEAGEVYPRISQSEAVSIASRYLGKDSSSRKYGSNRVSRMESNASLVWSKSFGTSKFHPSYEVSFEKGEKVYVHPDGTVTLKSPIKSERKVGSIFSDK
ncbi:MAG: hypothetical protein PHY73_01415 [Candidatus Omnitrophica bacterium]|nr:hypothetical protein [Candidatus Omnitrophota bacterium]